MKALRMVCSLLCLLGALGAASQAFGQAYPEKPVRLIVPWPPGGGTDIFARAIGGKLSGKWKQQVVVDNKPGAAGNIGAEATARSAPDGYTIMLATITLATSPSMYKLSFDPIKDFAPITLVAGVPHLLVVNPSVPAHTVSELVALAKAKPGQLNYASAGLGSPFHLAAELFKQKAGVNITHVPYKGGGPAVLDTMAGQVQLTFANLVAVLPQLQNGKLRALGVTSAQRSKAAPNIPTIAEAGLPGYKFSSWFGFFAPAGTPAEILKKLNADIVAVLNAPDIQERLSKDGAELVASTPEEFGAFLREETKTWTEVVKAAGIKAE